MSDEVQAATAAAAPVAPVAPAAETAEKTAEKQLQDQVADLQSQLAARKDALADSEAALREADARNELLVDRLVEAAKAASDERAARGRALVASFQHAMDNNAPMTLPMLAELKALVLPA